MANIKEIIELEIQFQEAMKKIKIEEIKYNQELKSIISLCLSSRIFENIQAIIILLKEGNLEASIYPILRSSLEALIDLDNLLEIEGYDKYLCYLTKNNIIKLSNKKTFETIAYKQQYDYKDRKISHEKIAGKIKTELISKYGNKYKRYNTRLGVYENEINTSIHFKFKLAKSIHTYETAYFCLCEETHNGVGALETKYLENSKVEFFKRIPDKAIEEIADISKSILIDTIDRIYKINGGI